ncbi:MAG: alkyl hydroperoxide reductase, partial [Bdellovibrionales bacterium GWC1_52_8]
TDGRNHALADFASSKAVVVIFMCNHCPYVIAVQERINALAREYQGKGVPVLAINSNDSVRYPDDSFEAMGKRAREQGFVFPYLHDEDQAVARAYGAVCTPEFYLLQPGAGAEFTIRYHGRMDDNWKEPEKVRTRDLAQAIDAVLAGKPVVQEQLPSMGCSIKWK